MLTRLYVDNYKCFVNFTFLPGGLQLLMGKNGSGKSTIAVVLESLRDFVNGAPIDGLFGASTFNRWQTKPNQTFELEVRLGQRTYQYKLTVEHQKSARGDQSIRPRVLNESLEQNGQRLISFVEGRLSVFNRRSAEPIDFRFDWHRSVFAFLQQRPENEEIFLFKSWIDRIAAFHLKPPFSSTAGQESIRPLRNLSNFTEWLRYKLQDDPAVYGEVHGFLREVLPGFRALRLQTMEDGRKAQVAEFEADGQARPFEFDELSDGQQVLIALHFLMRGVVDKETLVIFDEPDNFVALREIQPWLMSLIDRVEDTNAQCLLISHHPELLNQLAPTHGIVFRRMDSGWIEAAPYAPKDPGELTPAELEARDW